MARINNNNIIILPSHHREPTMPTVTNKTSPQDQTQEVIPTDPSIMTIPNLPTSHQSPPHLLPGARPRVVPTTPHQQQQQQQQHKPSDHVSSPSSPSNIDAQPSSQISGDKVTAVIKVSLVHTHVHWDLTNQAGGSLLSQTVVTAPDGKKAGSVAGQTKRTEKVREERSKVVVIGRTWPEAWREIVGKFKWFMVLLGLAVLVLILGTVAVGIMIRRRISGWVVGGVYINSQDGSEYTLYICRALGSGGNIHNHHTFLP
ncbi:hypothetical protein QBC38DRAFT_99894 [Podospora fimiseda]|uniref:Uncharacterized protein n=1 Tax=Podospora fimiseda TaxID=252190 RepID=A0AAN6YQP9_9PEZI|nr:hypothetical protein QBC38DRAFT_99894 [Podospora fimiseda]